MIPTRNRSHIVPYAIESVLRQLFTDFEIVLIDNDLSDATSVAVEKYRSDSRFKYFRTGNLSMPDNWEFGYHHCRGRYFLCIEDKMFLKKRALQNLHDTFEDNDIDFLLWKLDYYDNESNIFYPQLFEYNQLDWRSSRDTLQLIENCDIRLYMPIAPRGFNFSASREKIDQVITKSPEKCFFLPISPDFTSGFQLLMNYDRYPVLPYSISAHSFISYSNGTAVTMRTKQGLDFLKEVGFHNDSKLNVPVQASGVWNLVIDDLMKVAALQHREGEFKLNMFNYFLMNWQEFTYVQNEGVDMSIEMAAFNDALEKLEDRKLRDEIVAKIHSLPAPTIPTFGTDLYAESVVVQNPQKTLSQRLFREAIRPFRQIKKALIGKPTEISYKNFDTFFKDYC